jgi:hypothetical protein
MGKLKLDELTVESFKVSSDEKGQVAAFSGNPWSCYGCTQGDRYTCFAGCQLTVYGPADTCYDFCTL